MTGRKAAGLSDQKRSQTYLVCFACVDRTVVSDIWLPVPFMSDLKASGGYYIKEAIGVTGLLTLGKKNENTYSSWKQLNVPKMTTSAGDLWRIFCLLETIQQARASRTEETQRSSDARQTFIAEYKKL